MEKQWDLARRLASLLKRTPGSIIFGRHGVMPSEKGLSHGKSGSYHTAESFTKMWTELFELNTVEISCEVRNKSGKRFNSPLGEWDMVFFSIIFIGDTGDA